MRSRGSSTSDAVVIGAGPAGLAAADALRRRGVAAVVLEQGPSVGTSWRNRHEDLRLNTIRWLSDLPGHRIPRSAGRWVARDDYIAYLDAYAQDIDIRCGVTVRRLDSTPAGWCAIADDQRYEAAHAVVATGHDRLPYVPDWPGRAGFEPPVTHVAWLRRAADLAGMRVLLVGAGNSGVEIAAHLVDRGVADLWLSVRTPPNVLPATLHGVPLHPVSLSSGWLPERARDAIAWAMSRYAFGDLSAYGLSRPPVGPFRRLRTTGVTVAVDQGFVAHLVAGRVHVVPEIDRLDGREVVLRDGQRLRPDVVLTATGFRTGLADLVGHLGVLDERGFPAGRRPGLWFIGYQDRIEGILRQHPIEARRIARAIARHP